MHISSIASLRNGGRILATLLFCLLVPAVALSEELTSEAVSLHPGLRVERIVYSGEFRTSRTKLASLTALREGMSLAEVDPDAVLQRLKKTGLYSEVSLGYESDGAGAVITVGLKEKMTLVPLPIASYSDGSATLGLIVIDSDFVGSRTMLMAGGIWSTDGWTGILNYIDPTRNEGDLSIVLAAEGGSGTRDASDMEGRPYLSIAERRARMDGILSFRNKSLLRPMIHAAYAFSCLDAVEAAASGLDASYSFLEGEAGLVLESRRNEGWYERGYRLSISYSHGQSIISPSRYDAAEARFEQSSLIAGSFLLRLSASAQYGDRPIVVAPPLRGEGFRTLPFGKSFSSKYAAASGGLELPFARPGWAILSLVAFYELGTYESGPPGGLSAQVFHGPGTGFRLYLKTIALPALGVDFAYNVPARSPVFSVAIGMHG